MTHPSDPDNAVLLETFNATYDKIAGKGYKHAFAKEDPHAGVGAAKRITTVAAWALADGSRELAEIDRLGLARPFAKVNGKGYVETAAGVAQEDLEKMLLKIGDRIARTTPSTGEGSMYHHSSRGSFKIF